MYVYYTKKRLLIAIWLAKECCIFFTFYLIIQKEKLIEVPFIYGIISCLI